MIPFPHFTLSSPLALFQPPFSYYIHPPSCFKMSIDEEVPANTPSQPPHISGGNNPHVMIVDAGWPPHLHLLGPYRHPITDLRARQGRSTPRPPAFPKCPSRHSGRPSSDGLATLPGRACCIVPVPLLLLLTFLLLLCRKELTFCLSHSNKRHVQNRVLIFRGGGIHLFFCCVRVCVCDWCSKFSFPRVFTFAESCAKQERKTSIFPSVCQSHSLPAMI